MRFAPISAVRAHDMIQRHGLKISEVGRNAWTVFFLEAYFNDDRFWSLVVVQDQLLHR